GALEGGAGHLQGRGGGGDAGAVDQGRDRRGRRLHVSDRGVDAGRVGDISLRGDHEARPGCPGLLGSLLEAVRVTVQQGQGTTLARQALRTPAADPRRARTPGTTGGPACPAALSRPARSRANRARGSPSPARTLATPRPMPRVDATPVTTVVSSVMRASSTTERSPATARSSALER